MGIEDEVDKRMYMISGLSLNVYAEVSRDHHRALMAVNLITSAVMELWKRADIEEEAGAGWSREREWHDGAWAAVSHTAEGWWQVSFKPCWHSECVYVCLCVCLYISSCWNTTTSAHYFGEIREGPPHHLVHFPLQGCQSAYSNSQLLSLAAMSTLDRVRD